MSAVDCLLNMYGHAVVVVWYDTIGDQLHVVSHDLLTRHWLLGSKKLVQWAGPEP